MIIIITYQEEDEYGNMQTLVSHGIDSRTFSFLVLYQGKERILL